MASSPVPNHFLFVDACRNDVESLRRQNVEGKRILNELHAAGANPDALFGSLYAAASGTQTWQPRELSQGLSIFGGALLDGLRGSEGIALQGCTGDRCEVWFYPLESFVKARMAAVLRELRSQEKVRVRNGGSPPDGGITLVPGSAGLAAPGAPPSMTTSEALDERYQVHHDAVNIPAPAITYEAGHEIFGSERMWDIWAWSARAFRLDDLSEVPRTELVISAVSRSPDTETYRVSFRLPPEPRGYWLQFADARGHEFACTLSGSGSWGPGPVYEAEIDLAKPGGDLHPRWVSRVEAGIDLTTPGVLGVVAGMWRTYQDRNAIASVQDLDLRLLEDALQGKVANPLAAAIARLVLLRARRFDLLHDRWLRNLSDWFPDLPDGAVLWAEQLRLQGGRDRGRSAAERLEYLARLEEQGLPRLAEVLPMARRHLAELAGVDGARVQPLVSCIGDALRFLRPGGLFAVFAGPAGSLRPALVKGRG